MNFEQYWYKLHGASSKVRSAYKRVFNKSHGGSEDGRTILQDLVMRFNFYGAKPTNDPVELGKQAARREIIEYILAMSAKLSEDTLNQIEEFINH
jgi:hypothetical protein